MTDGIIQEVFNSFRSKRLGFPITHSETLTLERELIEKIKQEFYTDVPYWNETAQHNKRVRKALIGDSK